MLVKPENVQELLRKSFHRLYILLGQESYILNQTALQIKNTWQRASVCDQKIIDLNAPEDWGTLFDEANSFSLFAENVLLDARSNKKSLEQSSKKCVQNYLESSNPRSLIIVRTPHIPLKQWEWLNSNPQAVVIPCPPLTAHALKNWIQVALRNVSFTFEKEIPELIYYYTQGNLLACAQLIEKLSLIYTNETLTAAEFKEHLFFQCEFQLYELADACLAGDANKALHILSITGREKTEPSLLLWLLLQEVRVLIQLHSLSHLPFSQACTQAKVWSFKQKLYQNALQRLPLSELYGLLQQGAQLDAMIKTGQLLHFWNGIERLALILSGKSIPC